MPGQLPPLRELAPRVLLVGAAVIWQRGDRAGLEFDFPIRQEIVDCLSRIYPPDGKKLPVDVAA